jgi:hypothetical protein
MYVIISALTLLISITATVFRTVIMYFITYSLFYPVDITHCINFQYYTVCSYATHDVRNVTWRPVLLSFWLWRHKRYFHIIRTTLADSGTFWSEVIWAQALRYLR